MILGPHFQKFKQKDNVFVSSSLTFLATHNDIINFSIVWDVLASFFSDQGCYLLG